MLYKQRHYRGRTAQYGGVSTFERSAQMKTAPQRCRMAGEPQAVAPIALHALLMSDAKRRAACGGADQAPDIQKRAHRYRPAAASAPLRTSINVDPHQHQHRSSAALTSIRNSIKGVSQQHKRHSAAASRAFRKRTAICFRINVVSQPRKRRPRKQTAICCSFRAPPEVAQSERGCDLGKREAQRRCTRGTPLKLQQIAVCCTNRAAQKSNCHNGPQSMAGEIASGQIAGPRAANRSGPARVGNTVREP